MILLNFSHPLTAEHLAQLEGLTGQAPARVVEVAVQIVEDRPLVDQIAKVADQAGLSPREWQTLSLIVKQAHQRRGQFPIAVQVSQTARLGRAAV